MDRLTKKEKKELRKMEFEEQLKKEQRNKLLTQIGIWAGIVAVIVISVFGLIKLAGTPSSTGTPDINNNVPAISSSDITIGNKDSKVVLIEYSDFQCPACAYYYPIVKQVVDDFKSQILFSYRFFPLSSHKYANQASQAAYAAHLQGKFWEMHDLLFDNQQKWSESNEPEKIFLSYAEQLKLDIEKYKKDYSEGSTRKFIENQSNEGIVAGVNSTPTFFLNNKRIQPKSYQEFKTLIQNELK